MRSQPKPNVEEARAMMPQNTAIILIPCLRKPIYSSPAPGDEGCEK